MKKFIIITILASLTACGGKAKKAATPDPTGTAAGSGSATGGTTYGGAQTPTPPPAKGD